MHLGLSGFPRQRKEIRVIGIQKLIPLIINILLATTVFSTENCFRVHFVPQCVIQTSDPKDWITGLSSGWNAVELNITFDSNRKPENISFPMFPSIKNLAINVDIAPTASICQYEKNNSIVSQTQTNCLSDEDVNSVLNQILLRLPNIGYFRLQLLSRFSLDYYFPDVKFTSLEHLSVIGFRVTFKRPLYSVSTQFSNLELEGGNIHSFEELSFQTCCKKLRNLFLGFNEIESISKPLQVKGLNVLSYLVLRNNRIRKIEDINFLRSFKELFSINLNDNRISFVGSLAFADLKKLKSISLKGNWLNSIPMFRSIGGAPYFLWELILSDNNITEFDSNPLKELSCLARLDLSDNFIDKLHFSHLPSLKKLILSNNCIEYFKVDGNSHNLKSLRLDGNKLTNFTEDQIIIFNTSKSNLFELDLSRNPFRNCEMFTDWTHDHELRLLIDDDYSQYAWNFSTFHKVLKLKNIHQFVCHDVFDETASTDSQTAENEFKGSSVTTTQYSDFEDHPAATSPVSLEELTFEKQTTTSMSSTSSGEITSTELDTSSTILAANSTSLPTNTFLTEANNLPTVPSPDELILYETESLSNFKELSVSTTSGKVTEITVPATMEPNLNLSSTLFQSRLGLDSRNTDWLSLSNLENTLTQDDALIMTESIDSTTLPTTSNTKPQTEKYEISMIEPVSVGFSLLETDSHDKLEEKDETTPSWKSVKTDNTFPRTESPSESSVTKQSHLHSQTSNINSSPRPFPFHGKNVDTEYSDNVITTTLESTSFSMEGTSSGPRSKTTSKLSIITSSLMPKPFVYSKITSKEHAGDDDNDSSFSFSSISTFTTSSDTSTESLQDQLEPGFQTTNRREYETEFTDDYKKDFENPKTKIYSQPFGKTSMATSQVMETKFKEGFEESINTLDTQTSSSTSEHLSKLKIGTQIATKQFINPRKSFSSSKDFLSLKSLQFFPTGSIPFDEDQRIITSKTFLPPKSNFVTYFKKEFNIRTDRKHNKFPPPEENLPSIFKESSAIFSTFQTDSFLSIVIFLNCISSFLEVLRLY